MSQNKTRQQDESGKLSSSIKLSYSHQTNKLSRVEQYKKDYKR
jgi:hypothetical protein